MVIVVVKCRNHVNGLLGEGYRFRSPGMNVYGLVKTRLRITANFITDEGMRIGSPKALPNFHQIVGVEEYLFSVI